MFGGLVYTPELIEGALPWLSGAYSAHPDLASSIDIMGIHSYMQYPPRRAPEDGIPKDLSLVAKIGTHGCMLAAHGGAAKPIWITEIGWPTFPPIDEPAQARYTVRATVLAAQAGAEGIFWYTLRDGAHPEAYPPEDAFGLLHNDQDPAKGKEATPKPAYTALRVLLTTVGERWATNDDAGVSGLPADGHAVIFRGTGLPPVIAVWTEKTTGATVSYAAGAVGVLDQGGASMTTTATGSAIAIGVDVTYLLLPP